MSAIKPHLAAAGSGAPAFTADDVKQYIERSGLAVAGVNGPVSFDTIQFVTSGQLAPMTHGESTGLPDNAPVCFAVLSGSFSFGGAPGSNLTYSKVIVVFDARTGNLIMEGGLE